MTKLKFLKYVISDIRILITGYGKIIVGRRINYLLMSDIRFPKMSVIDQNTFSQSYVKKKKL